MHKTEVLTRTGNELCARLKGDENESTELVRGLADAKQRIGVVEEQKGVAHKECSELRQNLREIEKALLDVRCELHELRRHLKSLDAERTRLAKELEDAPVRIGTTKRRAASPSASSRSSPDKTRATERCTRSSCR